jgi:hypothetical protein
LDHIASRIIEPGIWITNMPAAGELDREASRVVIGALSGGVSRGPGDARSCSEKLHVIGQARSGSTQAWSAGVFDEDFLDPYEPETVWLLLIEEKAA